MDPSTKQGVAELVRQRGTGEISKDDFFAQLAALSSGSNGAGHKVAAPLQASTPVAAQEPIAYARHDFAPPVFHEFGATATPQGPAVSSTAHLGRECRTPPPGRPSYSAVGNERQTASEPRQWPTGSAQSQSTPHRSPAMCSASGCNSAPGTPNGHRRNLSSTNFDPSFAAFTQRNEQWNRRRAMRGEDMRRHREHQEFAECSFSPAVGSKSARPHRRLTTSAAAQLAARLAKPSQALPRLSLEAAQWQEDREQEEWQECTFQPNLSTSSRSLRGVRATSPPRSREYGQRRPGSSAASYSPSFNPQTNAVPPSMTNATAYLTDDVFSRLAQPSLDIRASADSARFRHGSAPGITSGMSSLMSSPQCFASTSSAARPSSAPLRRSASEASLPESSIRFLQRQNLCEETRRERLHSLASASAPSLRPELCERSVRLAERRQQRPRPATAGDNRSQRASHCQEPEYTFKPTINPSSIQRDPRSMSDLSLGDQRRREVRLARMREDLERKQASTFKPKINEYGNTGGRLRILQEPENYIQRTMRSRNLEVARRERDAQKLEEKELSRCTFAPKVQPAPGFIRRMAASHRLAREMREKENHANGVQPMSGKRPEWQ